MEYLLVFGVGFFSGILFCIVFLLHRLGDLLKK